MCIKLPSVFGIPKIPAIGSSSVGSAPETTSSSGTSSRNSGRSRPVKASGKAKHVKKDKPKKSKKSS